jgi:hypothetical protein
MWFYQNKIKKPPVFLKTVDFAIIPGKKLSRQVSWLRFNEDSILPGLTSGKFEPLPITVTGSRRNFTELPYSPFHRGHPEVKSFSSLHYRKLPCTSQAQKSLVIFNFTG